MDRWEQEEQGRRHEKAKVHREAGDQALDQYRREGASMGDDGASLLLLAQVEYLASIASKGA